MTLPVWNIFIGICERQLKYVKVVKKGTTILAESVKIRSSTLSKKLAPKIGICERFFFNE